MPYWMERAWEAFESANADCQLTYAQMVDVFADCPIHGARIRRIRYLELIQPWLTSPIGLAELEASNQINDSRLGDHPVVYNFESEQWQKLKSQFQPGDQWYNFRSPPETWASMAGRAGIAIVRKGRVVDMVVTSLN